MASHSSVENASSIEKMTDSKDIEAQDATQPKDVQVGAADAEVESATQTPTPSTTQSLEGFKLIAVTIGVCLGALMMSLDIGIIATAIPSITSDFHDTSNIAWYPAAYTFTACALMPLAGKMATVLPLNWVYQSFLSIFMIGSLICGLAHTSKALIAGRAIAGFGGAGVASNGLAIIFAVAPTNKKPLLVAFGTGCFVIGLILAPVLGGVFTQELSWRWCFWINLPTGFVSLVVVFLFFKPARKKSESVISRLRSLDLFGSFLFIPGILMLLLALQRGGDKNKWNTPIVIGLLVGGGVTLAIFVAWENWKGDGAMIPKSVIGRRTIICTILLGSCHIGSLSTTAYYLPEWFQAIQGVRPLESGVRMLATVIPQLFAMIISSRVAWKLKYYNPWFFIGPVFMCIAASLYTQFTAFSTPASHWIGFQVIQGIGAGFVMQMCQLAVQLELKKTPELTPIGISLVIFAQSFGTTILQVIAGTVFNSQLKHQLRTNSGLTASEISLLYEGGTARVRQITNENFPQLFIPVLEAYNSALTKAFFVPVAATAIGFLLAFGIKWNKIERAPPRRRPNKKEGTSDKAPIKSDEPSSETQTKIREDGDKIESRPDP